MTNAVPKPSFWRFAGKLLRNLGVVALVGLLGLVFAAANYEEVSLEPASPIVAYSIVLVVVIGSALLAYWQVSSEVELYWRVAEQSVEQRSLEVWQGAKRGEKEVAKARGEADEMRTDANESRDQVALYRQILKERSSGFPTVVALLEEMEGRQDDEVSFFLRNKERPAARAAEVVQEQTARRREADRKQRIAQSIIEYYESVAPFLVDLREDEFGDSLDLEKPDRSQFTDSEREDPLTNYLTIKEYRDLTPAEKNQLALDRFWQRPKSKRQIGKLYERYVGYLYEIEGYEVDYVGIFEGLEDLGRDLICRRGDEVVVVQCKNWSQFKTIYEKHIFQFFGTVFEYTDKNPDRDVRAVFFTTTTLSDLARRFAAELAIELIENHEFDKSYPSIKCNIARRDNQRIYHLPFDQQYDKTKIEPERGEFYCATVSEAEDAGFRRAFRYQGFRED